jgi:hypothetical protein
MLSNKTIAGRTSPVVNKTTVDSRLPSDPVSILTTFDAPRISVGAGSDTKSETSPKCNLADARNTIINRIVPLESESDIVDAFDEVEPIWMSGSSFVRCTICCGTRSGTDCSDEPRS